MQGDTGYALLLENMLEAIGPLDPPAALPGFLRPRDQARCAAGAAPRRRRRSRATRARYDRSARLMRLNDAAPQINSTRPCAPPLRRIRRGHPDEGQSEHRLQFHRRRL
jgi:hypothetical protein